MTGNPYVKYDVPKEIINRIFNERVLPTIFGRVAKSVNNEFLMIFLGGQPGAGKSRLTKEWTIIDNPKQIGKYAVINIDDLRDFHPAIGEIENEYPKNIAPATNEFAWQLTDRALKYGLEHNYNMIYESSMRTVQSIDKIILDAKKHDYSANIIIMAVSDLDSLLGVNTRYIDEVFRGQSPRLVDVNFHIDCYNGLIDYIESNGLFDSLKIYNRDKKCIYSNDTKEIILNGNLIETPCVSAALVQERNKMWDSNRVNTFILKSNKTLEKTIKGDDPNQDIEDSFNIKDIKQNEYFNVIKSVNGLLAEMYDRIYNKDLEAIKRR